VNVMPQEDASFCLVMGWRSRNTGCRPGDHGSQLHCLQMKLIVECLGLIVLAVHSFLPFSSRTLNSVSLIEAIVYINSYKLTSGK
jgi:hypothetical protein